MRVARGLKICRRKRGRGGEWCCEAPRVEPPRGRAGLLDSRAVFYYVATGSSPAMVTAPVGTGSQYAYTAEDSTGAWPDGGRNCTLTLPSGIPVKDFWAVTAYDPQTRSLLRTDPPLPRS